MLNDSTADDVGARLIKPPRTSWAIALFAAVIAVVAHVFASQVANLVGYLAGTVVPILGVSAYRRENARRSSSGWYSPEPLRDKSTFVILAVGIGAASFHIWYLSEITP